MSDLYALIEAEYKGYDKTKYQLYPPELYGEILLGLHSMCMGAESQFSNGHTNVTSDRFIVFGVKGALAGQPEREKRIAFQCAFLHERQAADRGQHRRLH